MTKAEALVMAIDKMNAFISGLNAGAFAAMQAQSRAEGDRRTLVAALANLTDSSPEPRIGEPIGVDELDRLLGNMPDEPDPETELPILPQQY